MRRLCALLVLLCCSANAGFACSQDKVSLRGGFGEVDFDVEIADDHQERARGLMFRRNMPRDAGMLFLYEAPQTLAFWMRNTLIELDMLFITSEGVVRHIHHRAQPGDETSIVGGRGIAVLEINGGLARSMGLHTGAEVRHPFFGDKATWPCG